MKKRIIPVSLIVLCILSSCSQTPDNIQGNNHNVGLNSENDKVSVEHILDDFDEAFETKYSKFKLPDKSSVIINQPEEICNLQLKFVNSEKDMNWLKEKVYKLTETFNVKSYGDLESIGKTAYILANENEQVRVDMFSEPYYYFSKDEISLNDMTLEKIEYTDRIKEKNLNKKYNEIIDKSVDCANKINIEFGGTLTNIPLDLYIRNYKGEEFYELNLQPTYKGIGVQCITPTYNNEYIENDNIIVSDLFDMRLLYNTNLKLYLYVSCNNYTSSMSEPMDKIISFKGACDILEEELASNVSMKFDDVKLWYEPRSSIGVLEESNKNIKCTPKWFFISDNEEDSGLYHAINYVTVDCVTGEIEVFFPG